MAITFTNLGASTNPDINSATDASSYANTSWAPPTSGLIILFVFNGVAAGTADVINSVTGNSLTWNVITTATFAQRRLSLVAADAAGATTGVTTIDFNAVTQTACCASFFQATGVDLSGGVSGVFVQTPVVNSGGAATSGSVTLSTASAADNRPISAFAHNSNEAKTERANWTEMDDLAGLTFTRNLETQVRSDVFETTASATWTTSGVWCAIAAELKAALLSPPYTVHLPFIARSI